jgi:acyl dehydratase
MPPMETDTLSQRKRACQVGGRFSKTFHFDEQGIRDFATAAGDTNPLHHDNEAAKRSRFGGIIASGTHYTSLMMGLVADHLTGDGEAVGLEFSFRFRKAVAAGATLKAEWEIVEVERNDKLGGNIIHLSGTLKRDDVVYVSATGKALAIFP